MSERTYKIITRTALVLWTAVILYGSLAPGDDILNLKWWWNRIPDFDKLVHFGFYFVETALLLLVFAVRRVGVAILTVCGVIAFSAMIEILQGEYFHRSKDIYDLAANSLGALCAPAAAIIVNRIMCRYN